MSEDGLLTDMTVAAYVTFRLVGFERQVRIRVDLIEAIIDRTAVTAPFNIIGSLIRTTTGREYDVAEKPDEVMAILLKVWNIARGYSDE